MIDFDQIDKTIHEKSRLSILTLLASEGEWSFQDIKAHLGMSDGNLITHLRTLMTAGFVEETRDETGPRPRTTYQLTAEGKRAFRAYLDVLESIVKSLKPET